MFRATWPSSASISRDPMRLRCPRDRRALCARRPIHRRRDCAGPPAMRGPHLITSSRMRLARLGQVAAVGHVAAPQVDSPLMPKRSLMARPSCPRSDGRGLCSRLLCWYSRRSPRLARGTSRIDPPPSRLTPCRTHPARPRLQNSALCLRLQQRSRLSRTILPPSRRTRANSRSPCSVAPRTKRGHECCVRRLLRGGPGRRRRVRRRTRPPPKRSAKPIACTRHASFQKRRQSSTKQAACSAAQS